MNLLWRMVPSIDLVRGRAFPDVGWHYTAGSLCKACGLSSSKRIPGAFITWKKPPKALGDIVWIAREPVVNRRVLSVLDEGKIKYRSYDITCLSSSPKKRPIDMQDYSEVIFTEISKSHLRSLNGFGYIIDRTCSDCGSDFFTKNGYDDYNREEDGSVVVVSPAVLATYDGRSLDSSIGIFTPPSSRSIIVCFDWVRRLFENRGIKDVAFLRWGNLHE